MASLTKDHRPKHGRFWLACFTAADGRQLKKSTKTLDRREAMVIAQAWEEAEELGRKNNLIETQFRRVLQSTLERVTGKKYYDPSTREWLERWLTLERGTIEAVTLRKYNHCIREFLTNLGRRADLRLEGISVDDVVNFRERMLGEGRSPRTVNQLIRILGTPFRIAMDQGLIRVNPIASVKVLRDSTHAKGTFSPEQIRRLIAVATGDWQGLILTGYYTGARLGDIARLSWANVDLAQRFILFRQRKTKHHASKSVCQIPVHDVLQEYLLSHAGIDKPDSAVFPTLYNLPAGGTHGLSAEFKKIMEKAGIDPVKQLSRSGGKGRSTSLLSFHSLRHSFNSQLANAGVSQELRQKLTGHASSEMNTIYTHTELEVIREAIQKLGKL